MKRIQEITQLPQIKLKNVRINFDVKLLQYQVNQLLYRYNNKYAISEYITQLKQDLIQLMKDNEKTTKNKQAFELLTAVRNLYTTLNKYHAEPATPESIDNTLKFLLFNYTKQKATININQELEFLNELKLIRNIIENNKIPITSRVKNSYTLIHQLTESITKKL